MNSNAFTGGFSSPPQDGAFAFRAIMNAIAKPGLIFEIDGAQPPKELSRAAGCVILTLCDPDTPIALMPSCDTDDVRNWITFHTGAPIVPPTEAHFATGTWDEMPPLSRFRQGVPQYPDRSATLIVECDDLKNEGAMISGPGIQETRSLSLPETDAFQQNAAQFPLGVDFLFCAGTRIAGLPRTTQVSGV